jgi:hypothetical protein
MTTTIFCEHEILESDRRAPVTRYQTIAAALSEVPQKLREAVYLSGGRLLVVPGRFIDDPIHGHVRGLTGAKTAKIAADCFCPGKVAVHEFAHLLDDVHGFQSFSDSLLWRKCWIAEKYRGLWPESAIKYPAEMFAEVFANFHFDKTITLVPLTRKFMYSLPDWVPC